MYSYVYKYTYNSIHSLALTLHIQFMFNLPYNSYIMIHYKTNKIHLH